ncbi:MAG: hypothetical protein MJE77_16190 [Proteobacteria bacterium]|nr:hypothetical protein [Pseudomonadota bacterium]
MSKREFVDTLPDLITSNDYSDDPGGRRIRLRIRVTDQGLEVLGDTARPDELDRLLEQLDPEIIEQMLCG